MRRMLLAVLAGLWIGSSVGCLVPMYSAEQDRRTLQLLHTSENLRLLLDDWERFWFLDMPSHQTPHRNHGGII